MYGLKLEYDPIVDDPDGQTPFIDSDSAGSSYDGIFDAKDAAYFGGICCMWPSNEQKHDRLVDDKIRLDYKTIGPCVLRTTATQRCHRSRTPYRTTTTVTAIIDADDLNGVDERGTVRSRSPASG